MKKLLMMAAAAGSLVGWGETISQNVSIPSGWSAFYLEASPRGDESCVTNFFRLWPVTKVQCYDPQSYLRNAKYYDDGTETAPTPETFLIWDREAPFAAATLKYVRGGSVFICYATNSYSAVVKGDPVRPYFTWAKTTGTTEESLRLAAAAVDEGANVTIHDYFKEGPLGVKGSRQIMRVTGADRNQYALEKVEASAALANGDAFFMSGERDAEWPGVIRVLAESVDFGEGETAALEVENTGTAERKILVTLLESADTSIDHRFPVERQIPPSADNMFAESWKPMAIGDTVEKTLAPGDKWTVQFRIDRAKLQGEGVNFAQLLRVEDATGRTAMRVYVPMRLDYLTDYSPIVGTWSGQVTLDHVSFDNANNELEKLEPLPAGGELKGTILMSVTASGTPTLLHHAVFAAVTNDVGEAVVKVFREFSQVPSYTKGFRVSSFFMDMANSEVHSPHGVFADEANFQFTVNERSKENPFRHAWHPAHDGRNADYSGDAPSGDNIQNFNNVIKPESFSVTNSVRLKWKDATSGECYWTLEGLRKEPIYIKGSFILHRITTEQIGD